MANLICWICNDNLSYKNYSGIKYLNDDGHKPCFECLLEAGAFEEEPVEEEGEDNEF